MHKPRGYTNTEYHYKYDATYEYLSKRIIIKSTVTMLKKEMHIIAVYAPDTGRDMVFNNIPNGDPGII